MTSPSSLMSHVSHQPTLSLPLPPELLQETLLHLDVPSLLTCRRLNTHFRTTISHLPQYQRLRLLFDATVHLTIVVYGYSFLHSTSAAALTNEIASFGWAQLAHHKPKRTRIGISELLSNQRPYEALVKPWKCRLPEDVWDHVDRVSTITAALRLLAYGMRLEQSVVPVWALEIPRMGLDLKSLPDKETVIERLAGARAADSRWSFAEE
jgi:hypothetical protein